MIPFFIEQVVKSNCVSGIQLPLMTKLFICTLIMHSCMCNSEYFIDPQRYFDCPGLLNSLFSNSMVSVKLVNLEAIGGGWGTVSRKYLSVPWNVMFVDNSKIIIYFTSAEMYYPNNWLFPIYYLNYQFCLGSSFLLQNQINSAILTKILLS